MLFYLIHDFESFPMVCLRCTSRLNEEFHSSIAPSIFFKQALNESLGLISILVRKNIITPFNYFIPKPDMGKFIFLISVVSRRKMALLSL